MKQQTVDISVASGRVSVDVECSRVRELSGTTQRQALSFIGVNVALRYVNGHRALIVKHSSRTTVVDDAVHDAFFAQHVYINSTLVDEMCCRSIQIRLRRIHVDAGGVPRTEFLQQGTRCRQINVEFRTDFVRPNNRVIVLACTQSQSDTLFCCRDVDGAVIVHNTVGG